MKYIYILMAHNNQATDNLNELFTLWQTIIEEEYNAHNNNTCANCLNPRNDWFDDKYYCSYECKYNKNTITVAQYQLLIINGFIQGEIINDLYINDLYINDIYINDINLQSGG
jgi:hypothetical protein